MRNKQLVKKTISSFRLRVRPKTGGEIQTYRRGTKRRFLSDVRTCPIGEYDVRVNYRDGGQNKTAWLNSKKKTISAINAFTERSLLEEFLNE